LIHDIHMTLPVNDGFDPRSPNATNTRSAPSRLKNKSPNPWLFHA
jgi:hypothetical protein